MIADTYSVVVVGSMNPPIHHPTWYKAVDLLSADAEALALKNENLTLSPVEARFVTAQFIVECRRNNWAVQTSKLATVPDMVRFACKLYDEVLRETPINAVGFNAVLQRETVAASVGKWLAQITPPQHVGIDDFVATEAVLVFVSELDRKRVNLQLQATPGAPSNLTVTVNFHYEAPRFQDDPRHFMIADMLEVNNLVDLREAQRYADMVVARINEDVEK